MFLRVIFLHSLTRGSTLVVEGGIGWCGNERLSRAIQAPGRREEETCVYPVYAARTRDRQEYTIFILWKGEPKKINYEFFPLRMILHARVGKGSLVYPLEALMNQATKRIIYLLKARFLLVESESFF